jgi:uncharacterized protein (TIGR03435 family)
MILLACLALLQSPAFEVASIRPVADSLSPGFSMERLLRRAYRVEAYQLVGPSWMAAERYSIQVKPPEGTTRDQYPQMWQTLLAERFLLRAHRETRELAVYALVVGKKGARMKSGVPTEEDAACSNPPGGHLDCGNATMEDLAAYLNAISTMGIDLPVVDRTGLTGRYSFALQWHTARNPAGPEESIFVSIANLGLRLERRKVPMEVVVVDHLERRPTEN